MNEHRVRRLNEAEEKKGPVVYWMSRDQRVNDNWALLYAQARALKKKGSLFVVFCLVPHFLQATLRQYGFMLKGLREVETNLAKKNIPFFLLAGLPEKELPRFVAEHNVAALISDFDPLRIKRAWKKDVGEKISIPFYEVDTHNIVPCWIASPKQEYGAYTIRPKIYRVLSDFLQEFPKLKNHAYTFKGKVPKINWDTVNERLTIDRRVPEVDWIKSGEAAAAKALASFIKNKLPLYDELRNDPSKDGQSNLSPYIHFGQLAAQRIALEVKKAVAPRPSREAFLEELIVRRELSDNFCYYNSHYDTFQGFPDWAKITLDLHRKGRRDYLYSLEELEQAKTHDNAWNAAQKEMVLGGKMHGYMRMYWGKKILEWTNSPEDALRIAIYLNDKYELDGRDPNGYVGIAWSIGGVHDRAWKERSVFGKIRYMTYKGLKSKFDVDKYIEQNFTRLQ